MVKASHFQRRRRGFHLWLGEFRVWQGATKINHSNSWPLSTNRGKPWVRHLTWIFIFKPYHNNGRPRDKYYDHFNFINGEVLAEESTFPPSHGQWMWESTPKMSETFLQTQWQTREGYWVGIQRKSVPWLRFDPVSPLTEPTGVWMSPLGLPKSVKRSL